MRLIPSYIPIIISLFALGNSLFYSSCGASEIPLESKAKSAIESLLKLAPNDEEGFDEQADILLELKEASLNALEQKIPAATDPEKKFRLQRIYDMLLQPIDIKGLFMGSVRNRYYARDSKIETGMIIQKVNSQPVTTLEELIQVQRAGARKKGDMVVFEGLSNGKPFQVTQSSYVTGYSIIDYPSSMTFYIHFGHRNSKWDQTAKNGLSKYLMSKRDEAAEILLSALKLGCKDPLILSLAMDAKLRAGRPNEVIEIWSQWEKVIDKRLYRGKRYWQAKLHYSMGLLRSGKNKEAIELIQGLLQEPKKARNPYELRKAKYQLAAALMDSNVDQALEILKKDFNNLADSWFKLRWGNLLISCLKIKEQWDEIPKYKEIFHAYGEKNRSRYLNMNGLAFMQKYKKAAKVKMPKYWKLTFRNNFDVVNSVALSGNQHRLFYMMTGHNGKLRFSTQRSGTGTFLWSSYPCAVRVDMDAEFVSIPDSPEQFRRDIAACALFTYGRNTEVGGGISSPHSFISNIFFANEHLVVYRPELSSRKPFRISVRAYKGRVEYFINNKLYDVQFVPNSWYGLCGIRSSDSVSDMDNFEIYVPAKNPAEDNNLKIRNLYDQASNQVNSGKIEEGVILLEQVATLQPRVDELGRLCAAYLATNASAKEGRNLLFKRFKSVKNLNTFEMLLNAELHLQLFSLDEEQFTAARSLHIATTENRVADRKQLGLLKNSTNGGVLALSCQSASEKEKRFTKKRKQPRKSSKKRPNRLIQAYLNAVKKDPESLIHRHFLIKTYLSEKNPEAAKPHMEFMKERAPNITLYPDLEDSKEP